jgi:hypothetical protein
MYRISPRTPISDKQDNRYLVARDRLDPMLRLSYGNLLQNRKQHIRRDMMNGIGEIPAVLAAAEVRASVYRLRYSDPLAIGARTKTR